MIYALIVVYNKECANIELIKKLLNYEGRIRIVVFDNSEKEYFNKKYCEEKNIIYFTEHKNIGLSKAYNEVISKFNFNDNDYILILDDDTLLTDRFIERIQEKAQDRKADIYVPIVKSNKDIISPSNIQFNCRVKAVKRIENIDISKITAINSGLLISANVYKKIQYNEELFLDYVDHDFFRSVRSKNMQIEVLDEEIYQNFSRHEKNADVNKVVFRFNIYKNDFKKYCFSIGCKGRIFYYCNMFKLIIIYTVRYKKKFLKKILYKGDRNYE